MGAESEQPPSGGRDPRGPEEARQERYGPLELLRTSKADGRALLLFGRAEERAAEDAPSGAGEERA